MARSTHHQRLSFVRPISRRESRQRPTKRQPYRRRLRIEPLEERRLLAVVTVNTLDDTVDFNDGVTSLREALFATNLVGGADTIEFAASLTSGGPATLTLTQGELPIADDLTINGPGADLFTIDASGNDPTPDSTLDDNDFSNDGDGSRIFNIDDANVDAQIDVSISGLSLTGGDVIGVGGAISSLENLAVTDSTISGNSAAFNSYYSGGGGIYSGPGANLTVTDSTISNNSAGRNGGGIYGRESSLTITDTTISGNSAHYGGGINGRYVTVTNSTISDNLAGSGGGGIHGDNITVTNSTISYNSALAAGGIECSGNLSVTSSTISGNSAGLDGGGIVNGGNSSVTSSTISSNSAGDDGGGIVSRNNLTVTDSTISDNSAGGGGGGISSTGQLTVTLSTISGNAAGGGGGGINHRGNLTVTTSTINSNSSGSTTFYGYGGGGGIFCALGNLTVSDSTISGNSADLEGGGISSRLDVNLTLTNSTLSFNSTGGSGGGISGSNITATGSTISHNYADGSGGGIWGNKLTVTDSTISGNLATDDGGGIFSRFGGVTMIGSTLSGNSARYGSGGGAYVFNTTAASAIRHSTVTLNSARNGGGGAFVFGGSLALDHTILAANVASFGIGPDLTGVIGTTFDVRFSLIGNNAGSGLAATPTRTPDANGNLIGPAVLPEPLLVRVEMAAMGDFEAGPGGDNFLFEYSIDGGAFQPLLTSSVDEAGSQTYFMDSGTQVVRDDPLSVNGVLLNNHFQQLSAVIPGGGGQFRIRFTATNDGPSEAFAWRNLFVYGQNSGTDVGAAVGYEASFDRFAAYAADPDYTIAGDMFGTRSRSNPGIPGLPFDVVDDSNSIFPGDIQGIIGQFDDGRFFGVVDTVNGVGSNTDTATWTFNNKLAPVDPMLGPLADNVGPTMTHALSALSPALNMGDPAAVAGVGGVPRFDQRGAPFGRVFGGRIDIGAYEEPSLNRVVDTLADESDGNYGPGDLSLREAISLTQGSFGPDTITFAPALTAGGPATIHLTRGELVIRDAVNIVGPGQNLLTIDAVGNDPTPDENNGDGSRIFNVNDGNYAAQIDVSISGLTLTGGDVSNVGGAILSTENTTVTLSTISGNSAGIHGGGIGRYGTVSGAVGNLTVVSSTISGNSASGSGGGIFSSNVANTTVTDSTISGNSARFNGGGIFHDFFGNLTVTLSTISGNSADSGGGISMSSNFGNLTVTDSTINGNAAVASGGGISCVGAYADTAVTNSTISDNSAGFSGGGIFNASFFGNLTLTSSTITNNEALDGQGSGVASIGDASIRTEVRSSIIAGNVHSDVDFAYGPTNTFQSTGYNLIGTGNATGEFVEPGDQTGVVDPLLGPLANNGGPALPDGSKMLTHGLLPGSPAIDAGDPAAVAGVGDVPEFDQRGTPFGRVLDGDGVGGARIDVGAFELPPLPPALLGDYNHDGIVGAADYSVWRDTLNSNVAPYSGADGSGNGMVDAADCGVWKSHFGRTLPPPAAASGATAVTTIADFGEPSKVELVALLAIAAGPPSTLSDGSAAARSARGAAPPPADAVFTMLGQRTSSTLTVARTALRIAAVDTAISDSLLLVRHRRARPMPAEDSDQAADHSWQDTDTRREWTGDLIEKWRTVVRGSTDPTQIVA